MFFRLSDVTPHSVSGRQARFQFASLKCVIIAMVIIIIIMIMESQIYSLAKVLLKQHVATFSAHRKAAE